MRINVLVLVCLTMAARVLGQTMPVEEKMLQINGTELFTKSIGQGEPIVFLHGGPGMDHTYFLPQMAELAKDYRLIFFDQRTSGRSAADVNEASVTLDNFVEDIEGIRAAFDLDKMNLAGHSWGGFLAMAYAVKHPDKLNSIMLFNATPPSSEYQAEMSQSVSEKTPAEDVVARRRILQSDAYRRQQSSAFEALYRNTFRVSFYDKAQVENLTLTFPSDFAARNARLRHLYGDLDSFNLLAGLKKVTCPALIVHSENDNIPIQAPEAIHAALAKSEFFLMEASGHFPFIESQDEFFKGVRDFMNGLPGFSQR